MGSDIHVFIHFSIEICFNPRSRMGSDCVAVPKMIQYPMFQSTLPYGERRERPGREDTGGSFNPRSRMGSDAKNLIYVFSLASFNPRSRMGSDKFIYHVITALLKFQSTLPYGERHGHAVEIFKPEGFNPRSRMGSDGRSCLPVPAM